MDYKKEYEELLKEYNYRVDMLCNKLRELEDQNVQLKENYFSKIHESSELRKDVDMYKASLFVRAIFIITLICEYIFIGKHFYSPNIIGRVFHFLYALAPCIGTCGFAHMFAYDYIKMSPKGKAVFLCSYTVLISLFVFLFAK